MNRLDHILQLDESERQLLLMALAHLSIERPGFDHALTAIAQRIDNPGPQLFNEFKKLHEMSFSQPTKKVENTHATRQNPPHNEFVRLGE